MRARCLRNLTADDQNSDLFHAASALRTCCGHHRMYGFDKLFNVVVNILVMRAQTFEELVKNSR